MILFASATARADDYDKHLAAGDKLESAAKWKDALAEFEAALTARPGDVRALNEVGFTAFHAGNCARDKEASLAALAGNEDANARGVSLYNLGLCVEADDPRAAASLYLASFRVRVNDIVGAALLKAAKTGRTKKPTGDGTAVLAQAKVHAADLDQKQLPTPLDWALIDVLSDNGGSFQAVAMHSTELNAPAITCTENKRGYSCANHPADEQDSHITATGMDARAIITNTSSPARSSRSRRATTRRTPSTSAATARGTSTTIRRRRTAPSRRPDSYGMPSNATAIEYVGDAIDHDVAYMPGSVTTR